MPQQDIVLNSQVQLCIALYDNTAETQDELSFKAGDVLVVLEQEAPGIEGWWVCSFKGQQGICPMNRLRLLNEAEEMAYRDQKRTVRGDESYVYDMPQHSQSLQYDVPPSSQPLQEESYDVPKAVPNAGSLTPSSSVSSLTTDSNRSSLIQQEYDVPRASKFAVQGTYDVPRHTEQGLDMTLALEKLGRLESDVTGAISRLLGLATAGWRSKNRLEPRLVDLRTSINKLVCSLHDLKLFSHAVLASHTETGLGNKLGPLVSALTKAEIQIRDYSQQLESTGWTISALVVEDPNSHNADVLDKLVQCAATLTDDIRAIASFIQGNSTLLFKRTTSCATSSDDNHYINISQKGQLPKDALEESGPQKLSDNDKKVVDMYAGYYWAELSILIQTVDSFLQTVTQNQPPKAFLACCKAVVMSATKLLLLGEAIERSLDDCQEDGKTPNVVKNEAIASNHHMAKYLTQLVAQTKSAAIQFPSVKAVQKMVDAVQDLLKPPDRFKCFLILSQPKFA